MKATFNGMKANPVICDKCHKRIHWNASLIFSLANIGEAMHPWCFNDAVAEGIIKHPDEWSEAAVW